MSIRLHARRAARALRRQAGPALPLGLDGLALAALVAWSLSPTALWFRLALLATLIAVAAGLFGSISGAAPPLAARRRADSAARWDTAALALLSLDLILLYGYGAPGGPPMPVAAVVAAAGGVACAAAAALVRSQRLHRHRLRRAGRTRRGLRGSPVAGARILLRR